MLTRIDARSSQGEVLSLPLDDDSSGLIVSEITGLDPVKATIVTSSFAQLDGTQYQTSRRENRNIVIKLDVDADYISTTVRDLRKRLYAFFMPKSNVDLSFYLSEGLTLDISGVVESFDFPLFVKEPTATISIICFDPDFIDSSSIQPFFGMSVSDLTEVEIEYDGEVETGVVLQLHANRNISQFTIYHRAPNGVTRSMDVAVPLVAGDVLKITTTAGSKSAILTRGGTQSSVLYGVSPQSYWMELFQGLNFIRVYVDGAAVPFDLTHETRYGGL